jgi:quercetin dioxygenase-like cupin family protein
MNKPDTSQFVSFDAPIFGHLGMKPEIVAHGTEDERLWIEIEPNVWFRPLAFDMTNGSHCELLRVRRGGVLSKHRHPSPVHGFVLKGKWRYLEHSWEATAGSYVYEPPGEVHTLTVDDDDEMITFFYIGGAVLYTDEEENVVHVEDNIGLIQLCRDHFEKVGLGADFVNHFIR